MTPDNAELLRRVKASHIKKNSLTGLFVVIDEHPACQKNAFDNETGADAFSVFVRVILQELGLPDEAALEDRTDEGLVIITAGLVRAQGREVEQAPHTNSEAGPAHAHVKMISPEGSQHQKRVKKALADGIIGWIRLPPSIKDAFEVQVEGSSEI